MMKRICAIALVLLLPALAHAATRFVDNGCASSGTGATVTCGTTGPFKTISEGLTAMGAGDTLEIRGVHATHGTCAGTDGVYREYVGIWGTTADADPGAVPPCTSGSPCVIQGCSAASCGSNETAVISGLVQRTDWSVASGSGAGTVWKRTMEARDSAPPPNTYFLGPDDQPPNTYNPFHLYTGDDIDTLTAIPLGADVTPDDNEWFFNTGTNEVYFNPAGSRDPTDTLTTWVPDLPAVMVAFGWAECPSSVSCPDIHDITFRRLTIEGGRWINIQFIPSLWDDRVTNASGLVFESFMCRYSARACLMASTFYQPVFSNFVVHTIARGTSVDTGGSFGTRISRMDGGTFSNLTYAHGGADTSTQSCEWADVPWDAQVNQPYGYSVNDWKQANDVSITGVTCSDWCGPCVRLDCVLGGTVTNLNAQRVRYGVYADEYTPSSPHTRTHSITVADSLIDDAGYGFAATDGAMRFGTFSALVETEEFGIWAYNNFISHASGAAISILDVDEAYVWNNTIWQDRDPLAYGDQGATDAAGIVTNGTCATVDIRNNIISSVNDDGVQLSAGTSGVTLDYNLYDEEGTEWSGTSACMLLNNAACYDTLAAIQAGTTYEDNGSDGDPAFVSLISTPPNLHVGLGSDAMNEGVTISGFSTDYDSQARPSGVAWDIGADEYLACHGGPT